MNTHKIKIFKALSDETRFNIASLLARHTSMSCGELSERFHLSQPALSHHFKKLIDAEVILAEKKGIHMQYTYNKELLERLGIQL